MNREDSQGLVKDSRGFSQELGEDAISRQAVQDYIAKYLSQYLYNDVREAVEVIDEYIGELPPVNPTKTGHWIPVYQGDEIINYRCSECELGDTNGSTNLYGWDYCRRCGARMIEPQERSDKE